MRMFFKLLAVLFSSGMLLIGWVAWSFVRDVSSQHFGAFGMQKFSLITACVGVGLLLFLVYLKFPFSRFSLGGSSLVGVGFSLDSVINYPAEAENPAYTMIFSPEVPELYFSIVIGIIVFLMAILLPRSPVSTLHKRD